MNLLKISWANIKDKKLNSFLSALLMTLGIGLISLLLLLNQQLDDKFKRNLRGIDMVVGAKGSPLQLILSSIYQIDAPTGNVSLADAQRIMRNPMVKTAIPLAMGDNYLGYRIVGTNQKYVSHFDGQLADGKLFKDDLEVCIGAKVAAATGLKLNDSFAGMHGFDDSGDVHGDKKYKVVGIFAYNNSVLDQVILTNISSVWSIHEGHQSQSATDLLMATDSSTQTSASEEITSLLVKFRNPMGLIALPRFINENTKMQAAVPAFEINRLFSLMGVGLDTLRAIAFIVIFIAGLSVLISLYNSLKERKYEMALMLSMGASRTQLFLMLLLEGLVLAIVGYAIGIVASRVGLLVFSQQTEQNFRYDFNNFGLLPEEIWLFGAAVAVGFVAAALPSLGVYKINISRTLAEE